MDQSDTNVEIPRRYGVGCTPWWDNQRFTDERDESRGSQKVSHPVCLDAGSDFVANNDGAERILAIL